METIIKIAFKDTKCLSYVSNPKFHRIQIHLTRNYFRIGKIFVRFASNFFFSSLLSTCSSPCDTDKLPLLFSTSIINIGDIKMFHLIIQKAFTLLAHGDAIKNVFARTKPETVALKRIKIDSEKKKKKREEKKKYVQSIRVFLKYFYRIRTFFPTRHSNLQFNTIFKNFKKSNLPLIPLKINKKLNLTLQQ